MNLPGLLSVLVRIGAVVFCLQPFNALGFSIAAPSAQTVLQPGQDLVVRVAVGAEIGVRRVHFYWYSEDEEPLPTLRARPSLMASSASEPPFGGVLQVPVQGIGTMRLLAVGEVPRGRLEGREEFDEILVRVTPEADLVHIEFEAEKPWRLRTIGRVLETPVVGEFRDGVVRSLGGGSTGSTYSSSDERVVRVFPNGLVRVVGNGRASITVENRGKTGALEVVVDGNEEENGWPTAHAGEDREVKSGQTVTLTAFQSLDPDGDPLRYEWRQVRGNKVALLDPYTPRARFVAPKVSAKRLLRFQLRVTDMAGPDTLKGADSFPDSVDIWVAP